MMKNRLVSGCLLVAIGAGVPLLVTACEDSSSGAASSGAPGPTFTAPTSGPNDGAAPDAAAEDGAGDAPVSTVIPQAQTLKLMNLSGSPINGCIRSMAAGAPPFSTPAYRAAGIPDGAVSERVLVPKDGTKELKIIAQGGTCADEGLTTMSSLFASQGEDTHLVVYYLGASGMGHVAGGGFENLVATPGKDTARVFLLATAEFSFVPAGGGAPISLRSPPSRDEVLLDAGVLGVITAAGANPPPDRPVKTLAGGTIMVFAAANKIILCDDRAPAKDGLTDCSDALRAP